MPKESPELPSRPEVAIEGRILLVEDEEAVLEFARDVLSGGRRPGCHLNNGDDVKVRLLQESFDALVMNGKMPGGWNAPEVYQWLSEKCPGMQKHVLFTFAAVTEPELRTFLTANNVPFLVKPFEVSELISHARRLLQKAHAAAAQ